MENNKSEILKAVCIELCETRNELVSYLHRLGSTSDFSQNNKWKEMEKHISKIDDLLLTILKD
jgi:hypothetical protein